MKKTWLKVCADEMELPWQPCLDHGIHLVVGQLYVFEDEELEDYVDEDELDETEEGEFVLEVVKTTDKPVVLSIVYKTAVEAVRDTARFFRASPYRAGELETAQKLKGMPVLTFTGNQPGSSNCHL